MDRETMCRLVDMIPHIEGKKLNSLTPIEEKVFRLLHNWNLVMLDFGPDGMKTDPPIERR